MKLTKLNENKTLAEYEKEWEEQNGKTCDKCGTKLNDGGTCPKCDDGEEDSLKEGVEGTNSEEFDSYAATIERHKTNGTDKELDAVITSAYNDLNSETRLTGPEFNKLCDLANLPDRKIEVREAYDPQEFNPDATGPIYDMNVQFYSSLEKAIEEERWEDAAKEYCEIKADLDQELQDADKKPIVGKLFKLFAKPHLRVLDNYKRRIPAEYLNACDKKNENLDEGLEYIENIDEIRKSANGTQTEFEYTRFYRPKIYLPTDKDGKGELRIIAIKEDPDEEDSDWEICVEFEDKSGFFGFDVPTTKLADELNNNRNPYLSGLTFEEAEDICSDIREYFMNVEQEDLYSTFVNKLRCNKQEVLKFYNDPSLYESVVDKFYIDEIVPAQGGKTETERHSFDTIEELKQYVKDANLTDDDIADCGGCEVADLLVEDDIATNVDRWLTSKGFPDGKESSEDSDALSDDEKEELYAYIRNTFSSGDIDVYNLPVDDTIATKLDNWLTKNGFPNDDKSSDISSVLSADEEKELYSYIRNMLASEEESKNESLGVGAGLAIGGAAIGAGMIGSSLLDSMENEDDDDAEELNELLDIEIDAKGFGGSGNNVHVGPGSIPLTASLDRDKEEKRTRHYGKDYDDEFTLMGY